jgi:ubiquinone/menaquinone biosynthesis C-methylase UbiE
MADDPLDLEAQRLRAAYARRGSPELRLTDNAGQQLIVRERDQAIRSIIRGFGVVERMLDVGCGDGSVAGALHAESYVRSAVGLDLLPERIEQARVAHPALEFVVGDGSTLPFADSSFDVVLAMTVFSSIEHREHRIATLAEAERVLRPGGILVWYDMRRANPRNPDVSPFSVDDVRTVFGSDVHHRTLTLIPPLARRLGRLTGRLYPMLVGFPALRTHTVGWARVGAP